LKSTLYKLLTFEHDDTDNNIFFFIYLFLLSEKV